MIKAIAFVCLALCLAVVAVTASDSSRETGAFIRDSQAFYQAGQPLAEDELPEAAHEPGTSMTMCHWQHVHFEDFENGAFGWTNNTIFDCNCHKLLGGPCHFSGVEVSKTFENLPAHNHLRIRSNFWFLDEWGRDTAYAKVDGKLGWTQGAPDKTWRGLHVCGRDGKNAEYTNEIVDFVMPHDDDCVTVTFGSNLEVHPCLASWGLSNISIYVCNHCSRHKCITRFTSAV
eukprot:gnl/Hemi2/28537_TR9454_c1_g1_i2.p1 gnl/Hemi2/28537_TR9454_c1_g1~~gnl/Hemi2/28537_TR9454_c1_g1_i2.p1  ORF type:complete len:230 (-),score=82.58 gnl/Hemi2/28537_TR9454_c1_g1_i2:190-879(-)